MAENTQSRQSLGVDLREVLQPHQKYLQMGLLREEDPSEVLAGAGQRSEGQGFLKPLRSRVC